MGREYALKNVRIWFKKDYECRYISHLDLNRCMLRALHKSKIPIWHTEGFNPHPFATFPLPLSLGFRGINECMDVKLEDDDYSFEDYHEDFEIVWPKDLLGEMKEYRQLSEQNKDQIEVFFVPWDMLGVQRYLSR